MKSTLVRMAAVALVTGVALWPIGTFLIWRTPTSNCLWGYGSAECAQSNFSGFDGTKVEAVPKGSGGREALMLAVYFGPTVALLLGGVLLGVARPQTHNA
jgi:energy-coupling factor transporter transmembrane protein EcfT